MGEDEQLMTLVAAGDWTALERLLVRHEGQLLGFFHRLGCDPSSVAELAQSVMIRLYEGRKRYNPARPFAPWLYGIARHVLSDHRRRTARTRVDPVGDSLDVMPSGDPDPAGRLEQLEEADWVRRAVQRLPEEQRLVLVLRHWQGLTYDEIAETLGVPLGTVKWRLHDAMGKLGEWLARGRPRRPRG